MTNIICDLENFKNYIRESSEEVTAQTNRADSDLTLLAKGKVIPTKHDWYKTIECGLNIDGRNCKLLIKAHEATAEVWDFYFCLDLAIVSPIPISKAVAKEAICRVADEMGFHPNIKVRDRTEHSDGRDFDVDPIGDDRYFGIQPEGFKHNTELQRYCWEGIPEQAGYWTASMFVVVKMVHSEPTSFDLNPDPVTLLRHRIRERDEEILQKNLAAERAEKKHQETRRKLHDFLESIGDFDISGVPFKNCWKYQNCSDTDEQECLTLFRPEHLIEVEEEEEDLCLNIEEGFDETVKKIIQWAVDNGAREPVLV